MCVFIIALVCMPVCKYAGEIEKKEINEESGWVGGGGWVWLMCVLLRFSTSVLVCTFVRMC